MYIALECLNGKKAVAKPLFTLIKRFQVNSWAGKFGNDAELQHLGLTQLKVCSKNGQIVHVQHLQFLPVIIKGIALHFYLYESEA